MTRRVRFVEEVVVISTERISGMDRGLWEQMGARDRVENAACRWLAEHPASILVARTLTMGYQIPLSPTAALAATACGPVTLDLEVEDEPAS